MPVPAPLDPLADEDLQLALYLCYELHYRGLPGVGDAWEWHPGLLAWRAELEAVFKQAVLAAVPRPVAAACADEMDLALRAVADLDGPSLCVVGARLAVEREEGDERRGRPVDAIGGEDADIDAIRLHRRAAEFCRRPVQLLESRSHSPHGIRRSALLARQPDSRTALQQRRRPVQFRQSRNFSRQGGRRLRHHPQVERFRQSKFSAFPAHRAACP